MATDFAYTIVLWAPYTDGHAPDSLPATGSWEQIGDYVCLRQGGTAIETAGSNYQSFFVLADVPAGSTFQIQLWDVDNSLEIASASYTNSGGSSRLYLVVTADFDNLPSDDAEIIARYKLDAGTVTSHVMSWGFMHLV